MAPFTEGYKTEDYSTWRVLFLRTLSKKNSIYEVEKNIFW